MDYEQTFGEWLQSELDRRGWSKSDLAYKCKITSAQIGRLIAGTRLPGKESLNAIAKAFNMSPIVVFRIAGFLPRESENEDIIENILSTIKGLSKIDQEEVYEYAIHRKQISERREQYGS